MKLADLVNTVRETVSVKRIFAEPIEKDGVTVIPAATVGWGGGGGTGTDKAGQEGEGGGFGVSARPVGVYTIKNGEVAWIPAVDVNRIVAALCAVTVVYLFNRPRLAKAKHRPPSAT